MTDLDPAEHERLRRLGERMAAARSRQRLSLDALAKLAGLDEKTVRTAIGGRPVRPSSVLAICRVLDIDLELDADKLCVAGTKFGSYNLEHYGDYIGRYFAYRRGFADQANIVRTIYDFAWSEEGEARITFEENHRYTFKGRSIDYSQKGDVYINNKVNIIQLLTCNKGDLRLISLTMIQDARQSMSGIVATNAHLSFFNQPSAAAIFFEKIDADGRDEEPASVVGPLDRHDDDYERLDDILKDIEQNVGLFAIARKDDGSNMRIVINENKNEATMSLGRSEGRSHANAITRKSGAVSNGSAR